MPYINVNVSPRLEQPQKEQIKAKMGEAITTIPGKTEALTMVGVNDGCALYLGGRELENGAFIEVRLLGEAQQPDKEALTKVLFEVMGQNLGMRESDIYINIFELDSWGCDGTLIKIK